MSYEIRAMSLGEILDTGFRLVRARFATFVAIGLTASLPAAVLSLLATDAAADPTPVSLASLLALGLYLVVVSPIVSAAITHAVSETYLNRSVTFGEAIRFGIRLLLPLVGTALLMTLLIVLGLLLLILPGIYLIFAFLLVYQVMVVEHRAGWDALKRTRELSSGHLLRIFAVYLVAVVLMVVLDAGLSLVTMGVPVLATLVSALVQAVFTTYMSATLVVLYFDIRCRKEAFDLEYLAGVVSDGGDSRPSGA